jgi:hypothetical protein
MVQNRLRWARKPIPSPMNVADQHGAKAAPGPLSE